MFFVCFTLALFGAQSSRSPLITLHRNALLFRLELLVRAHGGEPANFASAVRTYVIHYYRAALDPTVPSPESTPPESDDLQS
ncbi:hypothetical protein ABNQ38_33985 (plasmid) [Azospirillum sp. A29]|uniref:hypothetical protein n=1 Tax=Azospirillum sp. A29 TaxID=3160606 RepID=UPI003672A235